MGSRKRYLLMTTERRAQHPNENNKLVQKLSPTFTMTASEHRMEIPFSKSKIALLLMVALTFVTIGLWFVIAPPTIKNSFWGNPTRIAVLGYASIIFFGLCAFYFFRKLTDNKPGLIVDDIGLVDNSSGLSGGFILWSDIENISVIEIHSQKLIMVHLKNPQHYINSQTSLLKRKSMAFNNKMYGAPLSISSNGLKISFDDLLTLLTDKFQASRK